MSKKKVREWYMSGGWIEYEDYGVTKLKITASLKRIYIVVGVNQNGDHYIFSDDLEGIDETITLYKPKITTPPTGFTNLELALLWSPKYEPQTPPQKSKKARSIKAKQPSRKTRRRVR